MVPMLNHTNKLKSATVTFDGYTVDLRTFGGTYTFLEEGFTFLDAIEVQDPFHPENRAMDLNCEFSCPHFGY